MTWAVQEVTPGEVWSSWSPDPTVILVLVTAGLAYGVGVRRLWSRARRRGVSLRRVVAFYGGLLSVGVALLSPIDSLGETLFSAHMVQHLILVLLAPPLLVYGAPLTPCALALPGALRRTVHSLGRSRAVVVADRTITSLVLAGAIQLVVMWGWHLPSTYQAAIEHALVHVAEHLSFLVAGTLFWSLVISPPRARQPGYGGRLFLVFGTALHSGVLGALLTFASIVLYPVHAAGARAWGLTPLQDQQLAGVIMWVPAGAVYFAAVCVLFVRWMNAMEERQSRGGPDTRSSVA